jgi:PAS domain S-box-containing protein
MAPSFLFEWPLLIAACTSLYLAVIVARRRHAPGASALLVMLLAAGLWAAAYALELRLSTLETMLFAAKIQYVGIVALVPAWFLFTIQFTRRDQWIGKTRSGVLLLGIVPVLTLILAWTNELHGLVWSSTSLNMSTPIPALVVTHGLGFWLLIVFDYLLLFAGTLWLLSMSARSHGLLQRQSIALLIGIIPVWIANVIYVAGWGPATWLDLTPFAMTITGIIYAWSLLHLRLLDIVPLARAEIFTFIEDAIIVVDLNNRIADVNPAANHLVPNPEHTLVGKPLELLLGGQVQPAHPAALMSEDALGEVRLSHDGVERIFEVRTSWLRDVGKRPLGRLHVFHDITQRKQAEQAVQQLALSLEQRVLERTSQLQAEISERQKAMAALAASEARNQAILATIPDLIVHVRRNNVDSSAICAEVIGADQDSKLQIGKPLGQLLPSNMADMIARTGAATRSGYVERVEYEVPFKDDVTTLEARVAAIGGDEFLVMLRDITAQRRAEVQLRYQANLLENVSDAVISVDQAMKIRSWNKAAERIYGYAAAEVAGLPIDDVAATTFVHSSLAEVVDDMANKGFWEGEASQVRRDGSSFAVWSSISAVMDETGRMLGAVAVNRDMSSIQAMQRELQESELRYREILESTSDMIFSVDAAGRFLFVNHAWREMLGYTADQVQELVLSNIVYPSEREYVRRLCCQLQAGQGSLPIDTVLCTHHGEPLIVKGVATAVFHSGQFVSAHMYLRDITSWVQAETAQQVAEQRYRSLFEGAPVMYVIAKIQQARLVIADCNALFVQTLGYERDRLVGKPLADLLTPGSRKALDLDRHQRTMKGLFGGEECTIVTHAGREIETLLRTRYERDEAGHIVGVRAMFVDISELKRVERQLHETSSQLHELARHLASVREEEQSRIAREIHDELGQVLTVFKMGVNWLAHHLDNEGEAVQRKLAAMNDQLGTAIMTVQRIASELRPALLDNLGLVDALEWLTCNYAERTGIACTFVHSGDDAALLDKDLASALFRISQEALTNVARHAHANCVQIRLDVTAVNIMLEIEDDGIGITQAQVGDRHAFGMIGMRERLYAWHGRLTVSGAPNRGTKISILVPRR